MSTNLHMESVEEVYDRLSRDACNGCDCEGKCPCHLFPQIGGEPCPIDCPNFGMRFDGCHRCDCKGGKE